jgi:hypothetical protein
MMMTRMAKKSDVEGYECGLQSCPEPRGGGRRRGKPLLRRMRRRSWKDEAAPKP